MNVWATILKILRNGLSLLIKAHTKIPHYSRRNVMALIYFVEDDEAIRYIIDKTIKNAHYDGQGFENGLSFKQAYAKVKPDLVCLDVMLPNESGLDLLKWVRRQDTKVPVIMISALQSEMDKVIALDLGADDYITKPFGVLELTSRIQAKLRHLASNGKMMRGNMILEERKRLVSVKEVPLRLTNKEYLIFKVLFTKWPEVVDKETIFRSVWDTNYIGESRTLDMHIKSLRKKMKAAEANVAIETIRGVGYQIK